MFILIGSVVIVAICVGVGLLAFLPSKREEFEEDLFGEDEDE